MPRPPMAECGMRCGKGVGIYLQKAHFANSSNLNYLQNSPFANVFVFPACMDSISYTVASRKSKNQVT
jgi:hypothetical protein